MELKEYIKIFKKKIKDFVEREREEFKKK